MRDPRADYIRQVGRKLELPCRQRRALRAGLRQELEEHFAGAEIRPEMIRTQVGTPEETARSLMESVSPEEREQYRVKKRRQTRCVAAAVAAILVLALAVTIGMILLLMYR